MHNVADVAVLTNTMKRYNTFQKARVYQGSHAIRKHKAEIEAVEQSKNIQAYIVCRASNYKPNNEPRSVKLSKNVKSKVLLTQKPVGFLSSLLCR